MIMYIINYSSFLYQLRTKQVNHMTPTKYHLVRTTKGIKNNKKRIENIIIKKYIFILHTRRRYYSLIIQYEIISLTPKHKLTLTKVKAIL